MSLVLLAIIGLGAAAALGAWFTRLYRAGRPEVVFGVLVGVLLAESYLNSSASAVEEGGLFRPVVAGQDFRPADLVILVGVVVRILQARGLGRIGGIAAGWAAFIAWYAVAAYQGLVNGNPASEVLFHGKALFYLVGCAVLAAPLDLPKVLSSVAWARWRWWLAGVGSVFVLATLLGLKVSIRLPLLPLPRAGILNNDAITMVSGIGLVLTLTLVCQAHRPVLLAMACAVAVAAPLAGAQRANFIGLAASLAVVLVAALGATWRRHVMVRPAEFAVFAALAGLAGLVGLLVGGDKVDVFAKFDETFFAGVESQTAAVRVETWRQAREMIAERPITGWGLGIEQNIGPVGAEVWRGARAEAREIAAHNLVFDVTLRAGLVGLTLLTLAVVLTAAGVVRVWRRHRDPATAMFVLGIGALLAAVLAKGMVESVFEKYRLTAVIGLCVGLVVAALRDVAGDDDEPVDPTVGLRRPRDLTR